MDPDKFLELSRLLNDLPLGDNKFNFHAIRYKFFYDNSPRKHNCTYARQTRLHFTQENEKEKLISFLGQHYQGRIFTLLGEL